MKVVDLRPDDYWGLCPKCHGRGFNMHFDRWEHWQVCKKHRLKWFAGGGIISFPFTDTGEWSWERGEEILKHNRFVLASYQEAEPFHWPPESPMSAAYQISQSRQVK